MSVACQLAIRFLGGLRTVRVDVSAAAVYSFAMAWYHSLGERIRIGRLLRHVGQRSKDPPRPQVLKNGTEVRSEQTSAVPLLGLHIPKCAGTTLLDRVRTQLPYWTYYQTTSALQNYHSGTPIFTQLLRRHRLKFVFGHYVHEEMLKYLEGVPALFTGLRHPADRLRSAIAYEQRQADQYGRERPDASTIASWNQDRLCLLLITSFPTIAGTDGSVVDRAMRVLAACSLVYFTENFEDACELISAHLGIDTMHGKNAGVGGSDTTALPNGYEDIIANDVELYNRARRAFTLPTQLPLAPTSVVAEFARLPADEDKLEQFLSTAVSGELDWFGELDEFLDEQRRIINSSQRLLALLAHQNP